MATTSIDFRSFGEGAPPGTGKTDDPKWWILEGDEAASSVTTALHLLADQQETRYTQYARDARLYGNTAGLRSFGIAAFQPTTALGARDRAVSYNIVQSVIDTVTSRIGKHRPRPMFLTNGGNWREQRRAKKLNKFVDGLFYENRAYDMGTVAFRDGCVWGDGIIHVFVGPSGRVAWERVMPFELFADEVEGFYGNPRSMHRVKDVDRAMLARMFPEKADVIKDAPAAAWNNSIVNGRIADLVTVRESWHLASGPKAKDGKHVITLDGHALTDVEDWPHDFFPFARFSWSPRLTGFWSQGLSEQVQSIQIEVNKLLWLIQRSYHLGGSFKILIENGSKIVTEHLNNEVGAVIKYTGQKPDYIVPPLVPPEIYQHLQTLIRQAYEQAGISMLSATSQKPAGLESGKALRTFNDIESDRFQTVGRQYERFYLDLARLSIQMVKAASSNGSYKVKAPGKWSTSEIDWKDVSLDEDSYVMQCFPTSSLPNDPAGRLATVQEYMQAGLLSPRRGRNLLDFPDLEQEEAFANAAENYQSMVLDLIVEEGIITQPEPLDDLQLAREMALEYYAAGKCQGLEEERLELLRRYIQSVDFLLTPMTLPTPVPGAEPLAPPMAPAPSDLVPNVPMPAQMPV